MTKSTSTKRSLTANLLVLLVCISLLILATFAWFTDSASTKGNKIVAGKLDIGIVSEDKSQSLEGEMLSWQLTENDSRTQDQILWEPGASYTLTPFRVVNNGSLAVKYQIAVTGVSGDADLLDALEFTITLPDGSTQTTTDLSSFVGHLAAGPDAYSDVITICAKMKESAGNEHQNKTLDGIGVTVTATQDTVESDSTSNLYDQNASFAETVSTDSELQAALNAGKDVILGQSIKTDQMLTVSSDTIIYGNGNTLTSSASRVFAVNNVEGPITLTLSGVTLDSSSTESGNRGISLYGSQNVSLVVENCDISTSYYALCVASANENVTVSVKDSTLDGYSAFETWTSGTTASFENCTIIGNNSFDYGYGWNDYAAVVINEDANNCTLTFTNCRFENKTLGNGNQEFFLSLRASGTTITLNNCSFSLDGTQLSTSDLLSGSYIEVYSGISNNTIVIDRTSYQIN